MIPCLYLPLWLLQNRQFLEVTMNFSFKWIFLFIFFIKISLQLNLKDLIGQFLSNIWIMHRFRWTIKTYFSFCMFFLWWKLNLLEVHNEFTLMCFDRNAIFWASVPRYFLNPQVSLEKSWGFRHINWSSSEWSSAVECFNKKITKL